MGSDKIKAVSADIIVTGDVDKPYYEIKWYGAEDGEEHIGYSSYDLSNVKGWLDSLFDIEEYNSIMPVLRKCPCCGGEAKIYVTDGVRIVCTECRLSTVSVRDDGLAKSSRHISAIERVIELWNKRVDEKCHV